MRILAVLLLTTAAAAASPIPMVPIPPGLPITEPAAPPAPAHCDRGCPV